MRAILVSEYGGPEVLTVAERVHIGGRYALADVRSAHQELESRRSSGKLILIP